ncbi:uncharacterized protein METZ01_LOCUS211636, partial [marine metagenome]
VFLYNTAGQLRSFPPLTRLVAAVLMQTTYRTQAEWQSGYAAACKAVYAGSIPASASNNLMNP